jgi:gliding motility-associated lipoprotein GldD
MRAGVLSWLIAGMGICFSCSEYTPRPRAYFRIEPPAPRYVSLPLDDLPYSFRLSLQATVELPPADKDGGWINLAYPALGAKIHCSYLRVNPSTLEVAINESRALVSRQARDVQAITEQAYSNPQEGIYATLYESDGASASPLQFMLTDSVTHFFRGALFYDCTPNPDSLAPVTHYLKADIIELIQSFSWKK